MSSNHRHIFASKDQNICSNKRKVRVYELRIIGWILLGSVEIVNAHGTKEIVRSSESSNYRVFELTCDKIIVQCNNN